MPWKFQVFGNCNKMTFKSALTKTTLPPIFGMPGKVDYLSSLRVVSGSYEDWDLVPYTDRGGS
jgi:hypothetical protein